MEEPPTQKLIDYCCIMLHDRVHLGYMRVSNDELVRIFIRNSLQVPSLTRITDYFEYHIAGKSAISTFGGGNYVRDWCRHYKRLIKQPEYSNMIPLTKLEQSEIKDIRFIQYRILAYEVENNINGIENFDRFFQRNLKWKTPERMLNLQDKEVKRNTITKN